MLIGLLCFGLTVYQCVLLFENYNKRDTVSKSSEIHIKEEFLTATIIICTDPPNLNESHDIIKETVHDGTNFTLKSPQKMKTIFKVQFTLLLIILPCHYLFIIYVPTSRDIVISFPAKCSCPLMLMNTGIFALIPHRLWFCMQCFHLREYSFQTFILRKPFSQLN